MSNKKTESIRAAREHAITVLGHLLDRLLKISQRRDEGHYITVSHRKWLFLMTAVLVLGYAVCRIVEHNIIAFLVVYLGLGSIATISVFAEQTYYLRIKEIKKNFLGQCNSYEHNNNMAILLTQYQAKWNFSGNMAVRIIGTILFFGILGLSLMGNYPAPSILIIYLLMFAFAVGLSMVGYYQYKALFGFIEALASKFEPSQKGIRIITSEKTKWLVELAQLHDYYSAVFFCMAAIYIVACCVFCFWSEFGVFDNWSKPVKTILLIVFWIKVLYELTINYFKKNYQGRRNLQVLAEKIRDRHLEGIRNCFHDPISPEDYSSYSLYLQMQQLRILPNTDKLMSFFRTSGAVVSYIASALSIIMLIVETF